MVYNYFLSQRNGEFENERLFDTKASKSPIVVYMYEIIVAYFQELAFYLLKLKKIGINNEIIKSNVLDVFSGMTLNIEYSEEQFLSIISRAFCDLQQAKSLYIEVSKNNNLQTDFCRSIVKNPQKLAYSDAIRQGQRLFNLKFDKFTVEELHIFDILIEVSKSLCVHLVELRELGGDSDKAYELLLNFLRMTKGGENFKEEIYSKIMEMVEMDHELLFNLHEIRTHLYGELSPSEVSLTTRENKAILVSGTNLKELELVLEATKDKGIDVYTYGHMLTAHAYPQLKAYPHLVGHYGRGVDTYLLDFSEFPGAIFMTKHSFQHVENLYRSRIFTTDVVAPKGVVKILDNNFEPLITSALEAKGFTKTVNRYPIKLCLDERLILNELKEVALKLKTGEIKHLFTIGVSNYTAKQKEYFDEFLSLITPDCFVLSFSYENSKPNVFHVESDYGLPFLYKFLAAASLQKSFDELKPTIFFTRYDVHTISNLLYVKKILGIDKIYMDEASATFFNPSIVDFLIQEFGIKNFKEPRSDFKEMTEG